MQDIDGMIDFFLYEKGESITINGAEQVALVMDAVDKITYYDDKMIRCKCQIKTGDIVEYNHSKYIISSQIDKDENSYRARMRKSNYRIAFNWSGNIKWFDCLAISTSTYANRYIVLKATLSDDATVFKEFTVQLKSLF